MTREETQDYIREHASEYFKPDKSGKGYVCPICGGGSKVHGTGITENPKHKGHFTCWAGCFSNADIFEIIGKEYGLSGFNEIFERACDIFGVKPERADTYSYRQGERMKKTTKTAMKQPEGQKRSDASVDYQEFYKEATKHIGETSYHRGISLETLRDYWIGYVPDWKHPKIANAPTSPRLIIPNSLTGYLARDTRENITEAEKQYTKQRVGNIGVFNAKAIARSEKPLYVVEGEIDALSIIDVGGEAVALCSTTNTKRFLELIANQPPKQGLILSLDNDDAGRKATKTISDEFDYNGILYCVYELPSQYKDANEFLCTNREDFGAWVRDGFTAFEEKTQEATRKEREEFERESVFTDIPDFLVNIKKSRETTAISTGFTKLDKLLDGGLYAGLYFVGALSSLGKTSFILQAVDFIAQHGRGVLFFSLEMAKSELMAKSLSRLTFELCEGDTKLAKTTRGILRADFNPSERVLFERALSAYSTGAKKLFISEGVGDISVENIREKVKQYMRVMAGEPPLIVIDYVQILEGSLDKATDKQNIDRNVTALKRLSRDYSLPILAISSFNRENYLAPVNLASFKESGSVEYSSDILIGLQYRGWDYGKGELEKDYKRRLRERLDDIAEEAKQGNPIPIELKILKNRNGVKGRVDLDFYSRFNYFREA